MFWLLRSWMKLVRVVLFGAGFTLAATAAQAGNKDEQSPVGCDEGQVHGCTIPSGTQSGNTGANAGQLGATEAELRQLISIPVEALVKERVDDLDELVLRVHTATTKTQGYCSRKHFKVMSDPKLKDQAFIEQWWRLDHVSPDRWHVTHGIWEETQQNYLTDEWITIGTATYQNSEGWWKNDNAFTDIVNGILQIDVFLDILKRVPPAETYRTQDRKFVVLTHVPPFPAPEGNRILEGCSDGTCKIQSWINLEKGLFARSTVISEYLTDDGGKMDLEASQSFTCFNELIVIEPPAWLNAESDGQGQLRIINTEVLMIPHHESPAR